MNVTDFCFILEYLLHLCILEDDVYVMKNFKNFCCHIQSHPLRKQFTVKFRWKVEILLKWQILDTHTTYLFEEFNLFSRKIHIIMYQPHLKEYKTLSQTLKASTYMNTCILTNWYFTYMLMMCTLLTYGYTIRRVAS